MSLESDKAKISEAAQLLEEPFTFNALFNEAKKKGLKSIRLFNEAYKDLKKDGSLRVKETKRGAFNYKVKQIYRTEFLNEVEEVKKLMLENTEKLLEKYSKELKKRNKIEKEKILRRMVNKISARFCFRLIQLYEFKKDKEWVRDTLVKQFLLCLQKLVGGAENPEAIERLKSIGYRL